MSAIRPPGHYAVIDGVQRHVVVSARDYVTVQGPHGPVRHTMDELDDLLSVGVRARWHGGDVSVSSVDGDDVAFFTNDRGLAEREHLAGDFHNGWHGSAPLAELSDVDERVTSIHPRRREP